MTEAMASMIAPWMGVAAISGVNPVQCRGFSYERRLYIEVLCVGIALPLRGPFFVSERECGFRRISRGGR